MKKITALVLAMMMIISLVPSLALAADEKITIEFFYSPWASAPAEYDPYEEYAEAKYGCDFVLTPATDFETQLLTRAAANDMPDVIQLSRTQLDRLYEQGVVLEDWTPFLEKMPTVNGAITDLERAYLTVDGNMIACPSLPGGFVQTPMIRKDWLAKLGLKMPTNIEELLDYMRAVTFNDPDGNGINDTYGYTTAGAGKHTGDFQTFLQYFDRDGNNFYITEDGKVGHPILDGTYLEYLKLARTIVSEGLVFPDWYTQGDEDRYVEIYNAKIGFVNNSLHHILLKSDQARNNDGTIADEWDIVPIEPFGGKIMSRPPIGALRTVSAEAAEDPAKMEIICRYLEEGAFPNEDFFILRAGYKCDGYDVLEEISDGIYFLGKSDPANETIRVGGSIMFGWGQIVQAEGLRYIQSGYPEMTYADTYRAEKYAAVEAQPAYDGAWRIVVHDPTVSETSNNMVNEFEIAFILGNKTEADYEAFKTSWLENAGNEMIENCETTWKTFGLIK